MHTVGEWIIDKDPACTEDGSKHQVCSVCNVTIRTETIAATGHYYNSVATPENCQNSAISETACAICEEKWYLNADPIGFSVWYEYVYRDGYHYYWLEIYNVNGGLPVYENNQLISKTYSITITNIYGDTVDTFTNIGEGTDSCRPSMIWTSGASYYRIEISDGYVTYIYTTNYFYPNLVMEEPPVAHNYVSVITEPTKIEDGYTTHTCTVCGDSFKDSYVDAIGSIGLSYKVNEDGITCTITGIGTCEDGDIYFPTCIDGYTVTAIGEKVFENLAHVKSIHISKTVTDIANKAFYKCVSITEIRIPENVRCIGTQIFLGCESLTTVYYDSTYAPAEGETFIKNATIKKIVFGDNLTTIPNYICYNCDNLEEIILSPNTKYIGNYAFYYCQSVEKIDLPDGLLNTGWYAFYGWNMTELIIPDSVTSIYNSFRGCSKLERIVMPTSIISVPNQTFYLCHAIKEVYYMGNELEWSAINISEDSSVLNRAVVYYYSDIQPANDGNYWHYVDGIPTIW